MSRYYVDEILNKSYLSVYKLVKVGFCSYHDFFEIKKLNKDEVFKSGEQVSIIEKRFLLFFKRKYVVKYE